MTLYLADEDNRTILPPWLRLWHLITLLVVAIVSAICFALWSSAYYPLHSFAGLRAEPLAGGKVLVSGHVMGSFFCVGTIVHSEHDSELNVRMRYRLACPHQRNGDFSIEIPVTGNVRRVTYGDERKELPRHAPAPVMDTQRQDPNI